MNDINTCPICKQPKVIQCRCWISERKCANGHTWFRCPVHDKIIVGTTDGKELQARGQCLCGFADVPQVIVKTRYEPVADWYCPRCNKIIGEKETYWDQETNLNYHSPCMDQGPIALPPPTPEQQAWLDNMKTRANRIAQILPQFKAQFRQAGSELVGLPDNSTAMRETPYGLKYRRIAFETSLLFLKDVPPLQDLINDHKQFIVAQKQNVPYRGAFHELELFFTDRSALDTFEKDLIGFRALTKEQQKEQLELTEKEEILQDVKRLNKTVKDLSDSLDQLQEEQKEEQKAPEKSEEVTTPPTETTETLEEG